MFDKRLLQLVPETWRFVVLSVALKCVALAAYVALFWFLSGLLGSVVDGSVDDGAIYRMSAVAAACIVVRYAMNAGARYAGSKAAACGKATVRRAVYDKLVGLGPSYREHVPTSQAVQLCGEGVQQLEGYLGQYLPQLFYAVLAPLLLFAFTSMLSMPVAIVLLACVPLIPLSIVAVMKAAKRAMGAYWDSYVDLGKAFFEAVRGIATLKVFAADGRKREEMAAQAEDYRVTTMRLLSVQLSSVTIMDFFTFGGAAAGIIISLAQFAVGALPLAASLAVAFLAVEFFMPMRVLGSYFHTAMGASAVIDQVFDLLDVPEPETGMQEIDPACTDIVLRDVGYLYPDGRQALAGVDFEVACGSFVGITGESGSGKSTLMGILSGANSRYTGSATIGGIELRDVSPQSLRETVTFVATNEHVFKGTYRTNLLMGDADASDYAMWNALSRSRLDDFVLRSGGLDTPVSEGGANLSGGQRQRLCVARALLRNTPVYAFDEATSGIDAESERDILTFVQELALDKTVVFASHRLAALQWADGIGVLENGRIVETGAHAVLASRHGAYARLWSQQERLERFARCAGRAVLESGYGDEAGGEVPQAMAEALEKMPVEIATIVRQSLKGARIRALTEGSSRVPAGHPGGVPLGETRSAASADDGEGAGEPVVGAQSERLRPALAAAGGLLRLSHSLAPMLVCSALLGSLGFAAAIGMIAAAVCGLLGLVGVRPSLDLVPAAVVVGACGAVRGLLRYGERLISHDGNFRILALVRDRVFGHLCALAPAKSEARGTGDLVSLLTSDIELLEAFYARTLSPVVVAGAVSFVLIALIGFSSPFLGSLLLLGYLVVGVFVPIFLTKALGSRGRELRSRSVQMSSFLFESMEGLPEILRCGGAGLRADELGGRMGALAADELAMTWRSSLGAATIDGFVLVGGMAVALTAVALALHGALETGLAVLCAAVAAVSFEPVATVAEKGVSLHQTLAAAARILDFLDEAPQTPEIVEGKMPGSFTGARLDEVDFGYACEDVLTAMSFAVDEGSIVRVEGPSGVGKSTMLKLLMRFWDVRRGAAVVSESDIRHVATASLRALESYMTQETHLFEGTIRNNIILVRPHATARQLDDAVAKASLAHFIEGLPLGLDTPLGEAGEGLSDGERQRVGLARMFLYDAPLLLLDEPTSNLDSLSEAAVLQALAAGSAGKTMVIVSHRASVSAIADTTYTMAGGHLS